MEREDKHLYIHEMVEKIAGRKGDTIALVFRSESLTYGQLNERAEALGDEILRLFPGEGLIGLSTTRNLDLVVGILGILKAGKAYVPLDPTYPLARLAQVVANSNLKVAVCLEEESVFFEDLGLAALSLNFTHSTPGFDLTKVTRQENACILYTSGSTGTPKGVCVPHAGLVSFLGHHIRTSEARSGSKTAQFCHIGFDVSLDEIFVPLVTGGTLYLLGEELRLDSRALLDYIIEEEINRLYLPFVELQYFAEEAARSQLFPQSLIEITTAGETLKITPPVRTLFQQLNGCRFNNKYGPTETCIYVTELALKGDPAFWDELPSIGKPLSGVSIVLLDEQLQEVATGDSGEICVGGVQVANGYLNNPEITAASFVEWVDKENRSHRIYRTGDLGRWLPDGNLQFEGRRDQQVKIRGNRIELSEIEIALMQIPSVSQAVVLAREEVAGKKYLVAYVIMEGLPLEVEALREHLLRTLPDYMVPSFFIQLDEFPTTSSGKVDRKQLPAPVHKRPNLKTLFRKPKAGIESQLASLVCSVLQFDQVGADDHFFELGGNSLLAQKLVAEISHHLGKRLPITRLYQTPTVAGIAGFFEPQRQPNRAIPKSEQTKTSGGAIAIIGMAGRFPGADTVEDFWSVLENGEETITFFEEHELDPSVPDSLRKDPSYVKARGIINGVEYFDPGFFGISPKLAALMDPQQRVFLQLAWEALEDGGYFPQNGHDQIGVFAGCYSNGYYLNNVLHHPDLIQQVGTFQVATVNEKDYIASRTAYHLDLKGPAVSVYSACSTSLLAIAQAVESIRSGKCSMALAGGASVASPYKVGHLYEEGSMLSADGHCMPFQNGSTGTLFNDGAGVVLLKDFEVAVEDGDYIYGVIKGIGVNNDGGGKGSFTAPSSSGQAGAIRMALEDADVDPMDIQYVEAHGTGTPIGDPIEIEGLKLAFDVQDSKQYCAIGSVKSNIGHLTAAAGVAGTIKTALALSKKIIPASLGFTTPNPAIDFAHSPFFVNASNRRWEQQAVRLAGVSSFGVGGTNVHVILQGYDRPISPVLNSRPFQLISWSAKSENSLRMYKARLLQFLDRHPEATLEEIAATLHTKRAAFNFRSFLVADSIGQLKSQLADPKTTNIFSNELTHLHGDMVFTFPGQGAQFANMGRELYQSEPVYQKAIDSCALILERYMGEDIRDIIFTKSGNDEEANKIHTTNYTQPAIFVTSYALSQLWMSWGVRPSVMCGHSIGEFVAAHLAGVFSLEDALYLVSLRGKMVSELPKGSMLSVRKGVEELKGMLPADLSVAAINSPAAVVVAGEDVAIADFSKKLDVSGIPNRVLSTSHAFHSHMMDPIVETFLEIVNGVALSRPTIPIVSTVTGSWLKEEEATDPAYWAKHLRQAVLFSDALEVVATLDSPLLLEVGPGTVTSALARQQIGSKLNGVFHTLDGKSGDSELSKVLQTLGELWLRGYQPDWNSFYGRHPNRTCKLPHYAFETIRCWVEPGRVLYSDQRIELDEQTNTGTRPDKPADPALLSADSDPILDKLMDILSNASGISIDQIHLGRSFLQQGFDSLLLTQLAFTIKRAFEVPISFRQLNEEYASPEKLLALLREQIALETSIAVPNQSPTASVVLDSSHPPVPNARLGVDQSGNPAWFLEDENNPGSYFQLS
ncbi:polyketide synthase [Lunatimonas lonarensis]|nr:polyketide synthase [Lunatimonas lonarensis]